MIVFGRVYSVQHVEPGRPDAGSIHRPDTDADVARSPWRGAMTGLADERAHPRAFYRRVLRSLLIDAPRDRR